MGFPCCQSDKSRLECPLRAAPDHRDWLSLGGTGLNCAGGPTPWNSWISCEEWTQRADLRHARDHGYAFEVPALPGNKLYEARPLKAMGRFNREAIAVDPVEEEGVPPSEGK